MKCMNVRCLFARPNMQIIAHLPTGRQLLNYIPHVTPLEISFQFQHQLAGRALCAAARSHCKREFLDDSE